MFDIFIYVITGSTSGSLPAPATALGNVHPSPGSPRSSTRPGTRCCQPASAAATCLPHSHPAPLNHRHGQGGRWHHVWIHPGGFRSPFLQRRGRGAEICPHAASEGGRAETYSRINSEAPRRNASPSSAFCSKKSCTC